MLSYTQAVLEEIGPRVAGFLLEPIQGEAGYGVFFLFVHCVC